MCTCCRFRKIIGLRGICAGWVFGPGSVIGRMGLILLDVGLLVLRTRGRLGLGVRACSRGMRAG